MKMFRMLSILATRPGSQRSGAWFQGEHNIVCPWLSCVGFLNNIFETPAAE